MLTVSIRELKQHISELIRRVREESSLIQVTYHGEAVVLLVPGCAARTLEPAGPELARTTSLQKEIVFTLAGASDIRAGVRIANRTTADNKKEARAYLASVLRTMGLDPARQAYMRIEIDIGDLKSAGHIFSSSVVATASAS